MDYPKTKRPLSSMVLIVLLVFYGIMGLISGSLLISDPSGASLGFTSDIKDKVPFHSFLPVGLFLFLVYGLGSLTVAHGAFYRKEIFFERISKIAGYHWSWVGGIMLTAILVIWLGIEGSLIGLDWPATNFTVLIGALIFATLIWPSTKAYYRVVK
jgi:hypothetical protein